MTNLTIIDLDVAEMVETSASNCNGHEWYSSNRSHIVPGPTQIWIETPLKELIERTERARMKREQTQITSAKLQLDQLARERHSSLRLLDLFIGCGRQPPSGLLGSLEANAMACAKAHATIEQASIALSQM